MVAGTAANDLFVTSSVVVFSDVLGAPAGVPDPELDPLAKFHLWKGGAVRLEQVVYEFDLRTARKVEPEYRYVWITETPSGNSGTITIHLHARGLWTLI